MLRTTIWASLLLLSSMAIESTALADTRGQPGLMIRLGESWIFRIDNGQPVDTRKVDANARPVKGEIKLTLVAEFGTTMTVTNNSGRWYNYHAFATAKPGSEGKRTIVCTMIGDGRSELARWPDMIPAIRIADFTETGEWEMICR